jgi:Tol biopolymer transport system component
VLYSRTIAVMLACVAALIVVGTPAQATFPGQNGKIVFAGIRSSDTQTTNNWEIYTVNPDGSELVKITNNPTIDVDPAWSPDGTKIAFMRNDANVSASGFNNEDIYVMNADGTGQQRLTDDSGDDSHPAWSPDGTKIAFVSNREQSIDIFIMDADGGNVTRLTDNGRVNVNPSWSPDGTKVAYQSQASSESYEGWEIHTINVEGTGEEALTNNNTADILPDWSPDGRRIVFQGSTGAEVMNADGTAQSPVFPGATDPAWSPDGKKIMLLTGGQIAAVNPDGNGLTTITSRSDPIELGPDWQPLAGGGTVNAGTSDLRETTGLRDETTVAGTTTGEVTATPEETTAQDSGIPKEKIIDIPKQKVLVDTGGPPLLLGGAALVCLAGAGIVLRLLRR